MLRASDLRLPHMANRLAWVLGELLLLLWFSFYIHHTIAIHVISAFGFAALWTQCVILIYSYSKKCKHHDNLKREMGYLVRKEWASLGDNHHSVLFANELARSGLDPELIEMFKEDIAVESARKFFSPDRQPVKIVE